MKFCTIILLFFSIKNRKEILSFSTAEMNQRNSCYVECVRYGKKNIALDPYELNLKEGK